MFPRTHPSVPLLTVHSRMPEVEVLSLTNDVSPLSLFFPNSSKRMHFASGINGKNIQR